MGANGGLVQLKGKVSQGLGAWSGWLAPGDLVAPEEGQLGFGLLIPLP